MSEYRHTHYYRNHEEDIQISITFRSAETEEAVIDAIAEARLESFVTNAQDWYLDDVQSEEIA